MTPEHEPNTSAILVLVSETTYAKYSVSCVGVWLLILAAGKRWSDPEDWDRLRLTCAGWWMGWLSATIARASFPPPKKLDPETEKRLAGVSLVLVALGLGSVTRSLITGKRAAKR
jgi:hypothetical protein